MANYSFKQYRAIDLAILTVILCVCEALTATAASKWFPGELYTLSPTAAVVCIVMMRWNGYAAIQALAGGLAFCIATGATYKQFIIYCIGNLFALAVLIMFRFFKKDDIRNKIHLTVIFTVAAFLSEQIGRWLVSLVFGGEPGSIFGFLATDSLSLVFSVIVVLISRKADGLFEDQKNYLIRTEAERRREQSEGML